MSQAPQSESVRPEPPPTGPRAAWILFDASSAGWRVAALPVLDRLLVALHRGGWEQIVVVGPGSLPPLPRASAWRIPYRRIDRPPARPAATLVIRSDTLLEAGEARRLRARTGPMRLVSAVDGALPAGIVPAGEGDPEAALAGLPEEPATGVNGRVRSALEARRMTAALWTSITSSSDGLVDRFFNRPAGRPLSRALVRTAATPNQISVGATVVGLLAAAMFALGRPGWSIAAALVFQISAILDCVDGDVARAVFKESRLGKWLDVVGDQVVHLAVFAGIAAGLWRSGFGGAMGWLGLSAMAGAALSFGVVLRCGRLARERGGDPGRMQRFLDAATSRDFSVLVLALAVAGRLEWFLWLAAVGSHLFWIALLLVAVPGTARENVREDR